MASPKINNERVSQMSKDKLMTLYKSRPKNKPKVEKELQKRNLSLPTNDEEV